MLYANHQIRYRDEYDRELESDYQALMESLESEVLYGIRYF